MKSVLLVSDNGDADRSPEVVASKVISPTAEVFGIPEGGWDKWCILAVAIQHIPTKILRLPDLLKVSVKDKDVVKKKIKELKGLTLTKDGHVQVQPGRAPPIYIACTYNALIMHS